jgi:hypothetical protein
LHIKAPGVKKNDRSIFGVEIVNLDSKQWIAGNYLQIENIFG